MRQSRVRLELRFPAGLEPAGAAPPWMASRGLTVCHRAYRRGRSARGIYRAFLVGAGGGAVVGGIDPDRRYPEPADHRGRHRHPSGATLALRLFVPTPSVLSGETRRGFEVAADRAGGSALG